MKKLLALMLAAVMALSLAACGGGGSGDSNTPSDTPSTGNGDATNTDTSSGGETTMSKEEMLEQAEEVSHGDIQNASIENVAKAKQQYCNKILKLRGEIRTINEDYVVIGEYPANYVVDVYLPVDEIVTLKEGMVISVVGKTTDEILDETENVAEYSFDYSHYQMPTAYLAFDDYEILSTDILDEILSAGEIENTTRKMYRFTGCNVSVEDGYIFAEEVATSDGPIDSWVTGYKIFLADEMLSRVKNGDNVDIIGMFNDIDFYDNKVDGYIHIIVTPAVIAE